MQRVTIPIQIGDVLNQSALVLHDNRFLFRTLILKGDLDPLIQKCQFTKTIQKRVRIVNRFFKNLRVRTKRDSRPRRLYAPTFFQRTYSIMVNVVPPQAECDPPALPDADDQSMHVVEQTPPWTDAEFGTYLDDQGVEQPFNVRYHVPDNPVALVPR